MDLEYLLENADWFVRELRKHYVENEWPVKHYVTEEQVVIISSLFLYVYYFDRSIRITEGPLGKTTVEDVNLETKTCRLVLEKMSFDVTFKTQNDLEDFQFFYNKYKE